LHQRPGDGSELSVRAGGRHQRLTDSADNGGPGEETRRVSRLLFDGQ
jgi:hypothetical protein